MSSHERVARIFDSSVRENLLLARRDATEADLRDALGRARLLDWADGLPNGLDTLAAWLLALLWILSAHYLDALRRLDATPWNPLQSLLLLAALVAFAALLALRNAPAAASRDPSDASVRHS